MQRFAESGYKQESLRWEHFRLFNGEQLYLIDLGRVSNFGEDEDKAVWVEESLKELRRLLPPAEEFFSGEALMQSMQEEWEGIGKPVKWG